MSTSKGQCCNVCVTTRVYNEYGGEIFNRNFGTDTIDMFVHSGSLHLIGNDDLQFSYIDEFNIYNSGNQKETYVVPFASNLHNNSNFGIYNFKAKQLINNI